MDRSHRNTRENARPVITVAGGARLVDGVQMTGWSQVR